MCNDVSKSSYADHLYKPTFIGFINVDVANTGGKTPLRSLIDHSKVESFGGHDRMSILSRVYLKKAVGDTTHLYMFNHGESDGKVTHLNTYHMRSAKINTSVDQY
ncbi:hypothetical protein VPH35_071683 [Triticum aestivum]